MQNNVEQFRNIVKEIADLYEEKNKCYNNSFGDTYKKLGIISAVTRISDKYNRLCNLAQNKDIDNLGESLEDTLKDLAAYAVMTLIELQNKKEDKPKEQENKENYDVYIKKGYSYTCIKYTWITPTEYFLQGEKYHCFKDNTLATNSLNVKIDYETFKNNFTINPIKQNNQYESYD